MAVEIGSEAELDKGAIPGLWIDRLKQVVAIG